jgi:SpoVK/Ycf46/Vps4 family AAA+-type ATPase
MIEANKNTDLLDVAKLEWPSMADTAIDRLVMPSGNKELIKAIARTYTDKSQLFKADFIYGKGEGQIILLHGPPGTGKTLTAGAYSTPSISITNLDLTTV